MRDEKLYCDVCGKEIFKAKNTDTPFETYRSAWISAGSCKDKFNSHLDLCLPCYKVLKPKITVLLSKYKKNIKE